MSALGTAGRFFGGAMVVAFGGALAYVSSSMIHDGTARPMRVVVWSYVGLVFGLLVCGLGLLFFVMRKRE